jgi:hypothetical protein
LPRLLNRKPVGIEEEQWKWFITGYILVYE